MSVSVKSSAPSASSRLGRLGRGWSAVASLGWEMLFWPTITEPFAREAEMWCEKLELMAGITRTVSDGTPQMLPRR